MYTHVDPTRTEALDTQPSVQALTVSRSGPPPEDRLSGPNAAAASVGGRGRRLKENRLVVWTPEALAVSRSGPPPEDRLSGPNAARPAIAAAASVSTARSEVGGSRGADMMTVTVRAGLQPRVYREGMQYMRERIADILTDLDSTQRQYYHTATVDHQLFVDYLKTCDGHFLRANTQLRKRGVTLEVIDSETHLVSLLNKIREDEDFDQETVRYLTEYWDNIKDTVDGLKAVVAKFETQVLNRLKRNYIGDSSGDSALEVCSSFTADVSTHMTDLERTLANTHILLKSFHSGLHQNLFDKSSFADLLVVSCDLKAFPLLRLVADVAGKVGVLCEVAAQWLVRDEQFMQEIQSVIREARHRTKMRAEDLKSQREKQKKYEKSVKAANILLHNNRDKLQRIETELLSLGEQLNESERDKRHRSDQLQQKESMVDFLQITLSQTKRNYTLQATRVKLSRQESMVDFLQITLSQTLQETLVKLSRQESMVDFLQIPLSQTKRNYTLQATRVKLSRQVKDLKELMTAMESDLDTIQTEIQVKAEEKVRLSEKVEHHEKSYDTLRCDMDRFSSRVKRLQSEVTDLSGQLVQLEIIHNLKISPEKVDDIYDRPSTVKLAPSLKEKIKERKRKVKPK
ncbi:hypothetical protein ACOMHN_053592 [Nucella lapillus]